MSKVDGHTPKYRRYFGYFYIIFIILVFLSIRSTDRKIIGSCEIVGSYMRRRVYCTDNYSEYTREQAENKAKACNATSKPVSGCESGSIYYSYSDGSESKDSSIEFLLIVLLGFVGGPIEDAIRKPKNMKEK